MTNESDFMPSSCTVWFFVFDLLFSFSFGVSGLLRCVWGCMMCLRIQYDDMTLRRLRFYCCIPMHCKYRGISVSWFRDHSASISQGRRVGTDTGCAGCRRVEKTVFIVHRLIYISPSPIQGVALRWQQKANGTFGFYQRNSPLPWPLKHKGEKNYIHNTSDIQGSPPEVPRGVAQERINARVKYVHTYWELTACWELTASTHHVKNTHTFFLGQTT